MATNTHNVFVTLGASNHTAGERAELDYYATDPLAMELLLKEEKFNRNIWECACGSGELSKVLIDNGYSVTSTDIADRGYGTSGVDFLEHTQMFNGDIITNPPYNRALEFVEHALDLIPKGNEVAMFLRISFLEGKARRKFFDKNPPRVVYVCSGRIACYKNGITPEKKKDFSSAQGYAWFVWEKGYVGDTIVRWIN